jgi:hypothetical protein
MIRARVYAGKDGGNYAAVATKSAARVQLIRMAGTISFVFVAFVVRSVFSTIRAVAFQLRDDSKTCPGVVSHCDAACFYVFAHIAIWSAYTPDLQLTVVLISSPIALLKALWGVASRQALQLTRPNQDDVKSIK